MHQPFLASATAQLNFMTTDELREIFSDDEKLDERIDTIVIRKSFVVVISFINKFLYTAQTFGKRERCDYQREQNLGGKQPGVRASAN